MNMTLYRANYDRLEALIPNLIFRDTGSGFKLKAPGYMDLCVDILQRDRHGRILIALGHYGEQNGDRMADPDMEIAVVPRLAMAEALTWQNDYVGVYRRVYPEPGKVDLRQRREQNEFLAMWLRNLKAQGHRLPDMADAAA